MASSWSELGNVSIYDVTEHMKALDDSVELKEFEATHSQTVPMYVFNGHQIEGYALSWSKLDQGTFFFSIKGFHKGMLSK